MCIWQRRVTRRPTFRFGRHVRWPALLITILAVRAPAQSARHSPVRLGDVYGQVVAGNPRVTAAGALADAAETRVRGASRPSDPQLQLGFMNYRLPGLTPMAPIGMVQLQLMQMIPLGGKLTLAGRAAGYRASAARERVGDAAWDVRAQAAMAFYDLYATETSLEVARNTLQLLQNIARTAESMYRVGTGRQTDVLRAQVQIARMAEDTIRMRAMRESMIARLNALRDREPDAEVGSPALPQFPDAIPTRASLEAMAAEGRPMIRAGLDELAAAESTERLARKEIIPDLQVGIQYGQRGGAMGTERMGSLMFGASLPIFARDRQLSMRAEMGAMSEMARADLAAMRAETRGRIGEAYAALIRARNLTRLYRTTVLPQADATVASALSAYQAGSVDFMTLLDDQMIANRYRQELAALEAEEGKGWAELEMLIGRQLFDPNTIVTRSVANTRGEP